MKVAVGLFLILLSSFTVLFALYFQYNVLKFIGADDRLFFLFWISCIGTVALAATSAVIRALVDD